MNKIKLSNKVNKPERTKIQAYMDCKKALFSISIGKRTEKDRAYFNKYNDQFKLIKYMDPDYIKKLDHLTSVINRYHKSNFK